MCSFFCHDVVTQLEHGHHDVVTQLEHGQFSAIENHASGCYNNTGAMFLFET